MRTTPAGQFADALALMRGGRLLVRDRPEDVLGVSFGAPVRVLRHEDDLVLLSQRPQPRKPSHPADRRADVLAQPAGCR